MAPTPPSPLVEGEEVEGLGMRKRERWELINFLTLRHRTERCVGAPWSRDALLIARLLGWRNTRPTALSAVRVIWYAPLSKTGSLPDTWTADAFQMRLPCIP
jgi:hypothetical protein